MFLKKIKIDGFKSFAKPIVIDFPAPLTAIVGPNGSGKSNVVDAIRWAMGEQSAKSLRGSKMSDIIFAGSADYKALHKASVTLYIDNSQDTLEHEKKQLRIKRSVSDDGQSDYYLNGSPCRLKDIEELLMDTGLGNDSYSIVGQGKIDSILNSKPEKLRELFEEAAGIVKHKTRKQEAERRLDKTKQDLQRIKDLVWELDKQVKPLKKAAEKAGKYQRLRSELAELEINLLLTRWENNDLLLIDERREKNILEKKLLSLEGDIKNLAAELEMKNSQLENEEDELNNLQETIYQTRSKKEQAENNLKILAERNKGLIREKKNHQQQLDNLAEDNQQLLRKKEAVMADKAEIIAQEKNTASKIASSNDQLKKLRAELNSSKDDLFSRRNSILNENMELNELQSELEKYKEKGHYLEVEIDKMADKRKKISVQLEESILNKKNFLQQSEELEKELISRKNEQLLYKKQQEEISAKQERTKEKAEGIKEKMQHTASKLKVLQDMEEDYQGYFRGVKNILQESKKIPGIIGVVADLIDVEKKYELAIEIALGAKLQNIVTEDDAVARQAVKYLKASKGGRATFLPLNMVKGKKAKLNHLKIEKMNGFLGLASDLINYQDRLDQVMASLLGKTIVAEDLDTATEIAKKINSSLKIVTLEGEYINSSGAITGGSQTKNNRGLLGRSREIEELKEKLFELEEEYKTEENHLEEDQEKKAELFKLQEDKLDEINQLEFNKNDLNKDILNLEKEENRLTTDLKLIDRDFEDYHQQLGSNDNSIQLLEEKLATINQEHSKERDQINNQEQTVKELEKKEEEDNKKLTDLKIELATVVQKKDNLLLEEENINEELSNYSKKKTKIELKLQELAEKIKQIEERKVDLIEMKEDFVQKLADYSSEYQKRQQSFEKREEEYKKLQLKYNQQQQTLNEIKDEYHKLDLKITRLEDKNKQMADRLMEEYQVSPEDGIAERIEIENFNQISHKIKEFKDSIRQLGPVNLTAIEEYEELTSRLDYLKEQQDDLLQARASIEKVIGELERSMSELFYQTFIAVKDEFEKTFEQLFNGGKAELRLTMPEDLLQTGVEIEAQPPGKQLKKLSLMSGGERALTAIALVFAFLKVNPSPMYILDEIDAPLDDANVRRFASYLKEYSEYVQFLLITHNKLMMTEADVIYGITMEEKGVSKMVSLRLDEEIA